MLDTINNLFEFMGTGFIFSYLESGILPDSSRILLIIAGVLVCVLTSYIFGSLNFAIIISGRKYKEDIRAYGSKNAGTTNMMRTYGKKAAVLTLLGDILKAVLACFIGRLLLGTFGCYIAGIFCVIGHMFPVFYRFKGGKGVATTAGVILMGSPLVFLFVLIIFISLALMTKYISVASIMSMLLYPLILHRVETFFAAEDMVFPFTIFALLLTVLVVFAHRGNISRLLAGKENKFSFKKSQKSTTDKDEE